MSLAFTINLSLLGKQGFVELARLNASKGAYARETLTALPGFAARFTGPTFNEFALRVPGGDAQKIVDGLTPRGVLPGVALGRFDAALKDTLLVATNESHRKQDIDALATALKESRDERPTKKLEEARAMLLQELPIFELGSPGRSGASLPTCDVPAVDLKSPPTCAARPWRTCPRSPRSR